MPYAYTSVKAVRAAFWRDNANNPNVSRKKIRNYSGNGTMHNTDTRCAFVDWLDAANRNGDISDSLANRATL